MRTNVNRPSYGMLGRGWYRPRKSPKPNCASAAPPPIARTTIGMIVMRRTHRLCNITTVDDTPTMGNARSARIIVVTSSTHKFGIAIEADDVVIACGSRTIGAQGCANDLAMPRPLAFEATDDSFEVSPDANRLPY